MEAFIWYFNLGRIDFNTSYGNDKSLNILSFDAHFHRFIDSGLCEIGNIAQRFGVINFVQRFPKQIIHTCINGFVDYFIKNMGHDMLISASYILDSKWNDDMSKQTPWGSEF